MLLTGQIAAVQCFPLTPPYNKPHFTNCSKHYLQLQTNLKSLEQLTIKRNDHTALQLNNLRISD